MVGNEPKSNLLAILRVITIQQVMQRSRIVGVNTLQRNVESQLLKAQIRNDVSGH